MNQLKIVVWDNIGNTLLGMRPWSAWPDRVQKRLLAEHADARERLVTIEEVLAPASAELVWLYDPVKSQRGFVGLFGEFGTRLVDTREPGAVEREIADADYLIFHKEMVPAAAIEGASKLRLIQHLGFDYRGVPMEVVRKKGIPVAATPLVNYSAVAEHVWGMILMDLKRLQDQREYMVTRGYVREWEAYHPGVQIVSDLTLGLLGLGEIARPVARIARAFNMRTIYWDVVRYPEVERDLGVEYAEWEDVFRESDVLSVQLALNDQTEGIIGAEQFAWMKPTALFVNTARGKLLDQQALVDALNTRTIRAAALDVYAEEPLPVDSPLHDIHEQDDHRLILTPHSAAHAPWTWVRDSQELWANVGRSLRGEPLRHLV